MLPRRHYPRLLEIGCAEGWMTTELANRADRLLAADISRVALGRAADACRGLPSVRFVQLDLASDPLAGPFEAIVCAGVLLFMPERSHPEIRDRLVTRLAPQGDLVLEHTRAAFHGEVSGVDVHRSYAAHPELTVIDHVDVEHYAITAYRKAAR
jgi:trans-aconitate methyltransferase